MWLLCGKQCVDTDTLYALVRLFSKKRQLREWFSAKVIQAREQGIFNTDTVKLIGDGLLYNVDRFVQLQQILIFLFKCLLPVFASKNLKSNLPR